ncbi:3-isopropylmalate dehydrogenase [uncultured Polaribacter sp.]|uniref:3-isopropylmalate dehydrogenase n=1 Tax=uncultured Polaribacter sp. TaxID=174711 RepID=UPI00261F8278|nr:3-isopropylmalate dehydrogenase [uncultured Polaribacter sp.]
MKYTIAVLPGDGIGPEVTNQAKKALDAVAEAYDHIFLYKEAQIGAVSIEGSGNPLPEKTIEICKNADAILFGAIGDVKYDEDPTLRIRPEQGLLKLRKELDLFCNINPSKAYDQLIKNSPLKREIIKGTDIVIYRELSGGSYSGKKELSKDGTVASDVSVYSVAQISRITHLAFKAAQTRRKKVTLIDKSNVLETSRLWRKTVKEIAKSYKKVKVEYLFADNAAKELILMPKKFDIILTDNLYGDLLSDEAAVITGSIGMLASCCIGEEHALFTPVHGTYPKAVGKDIANPLASILSAALMLEHLGLLDEAEAIQKAVEKSLDLGITTQDLKGKNKYAASTSKVGDFIADYILNQEDSNMNFINIHAGQSTII